MNNKFIIYAAILLVLLMLMLSIGCQEQPEPALTLPLTPTPAPTPAPKATETAIFSDEHLKVIIREHLGKKPDEEITKPELAKLNKVEANNSQIAELSGIQYCSNLQELRLPGNQISDISSLASLSKLSIIDLGRNQINDISPLASLTNLQVLYLHYNQISDISPLSSLTNLTQIKLDGNQISDASPLSHLSDLNWLYLGDNQISDVSPLASLTNLITLELSGNQISDVSPLSSLTNLNKISLARNPISDVPSFVQNPTPTPTPAPVLKPAEFTVSGLAISPIEAEVWEDVTVTAKVTNTGKLEGTYTATLKIDGKEVETTEITLAGGNAETITFMVLRDVGPSCDIEVDGLVETLTIKEGVLPTLSIGDKWVSKALFEGIEYEAILEVTGDGIVYGKDCYVMEGSIEPPMMGIISSVSMKVGKATMFPVKTQASGEVEGLPFIVAVSYSYEVPGIPYYPLELGKETQVIETTTTTTTMMGKTETATATNTFSFKVEKIEEITVPAGTFKCFKIVKYDETGTPVVTYWDSDRVKHYQVKSIDHQGGGVEEELVSYYISQK